MAISTNLERLNYGGSDGSLATGVHRQVIQSVGATRTLVAEESSSLCLFDRAAGVVYTLPTPVEGMQFEFVTTVLLTSNAYKFITNVITTQFLVGAIFGVSLAVAEAGDTFQGNGTTHVGVSMNATTSGGLVGGRVKITAISATQWYVEGHFVGTGTLTDPFTTS